MESISRRTRKNLTSGKERDDKSLKSDRSNEGHLKDNVLKLDLGRENNLNKVFLKVTQKYKQMNRSKSPNYATSESESPEKSPNIHTTQRRNKILTSIKSDGNNNISTIKGSNKILSIIKNNNKNIAKNEFSKTFLGSIIKEHADEQYSSQEEKDKESFKDINKGIFKKVIDLAKIRKAEEKKRKLLEENLVPSDDDNNNNQNNNKNNNDNSFVSKIDMINEALNKNKIKSKILETSIRDEKKSNYEFNFKSDSPINANDKNKSMYNSSFRKGKNKNNDAYINVVSNFQYPISKITNKKSKQRKPTVSIDNPELDIALLSNNLHVYKEQEDNSEAEENEVEMKKKAEIEEGIKKNKIYSKYSDWVIGNRLTEDEKIKLGIITKKKEVNKNEKKLKEIFGPGISLKANPDSTKSKSSAHAKGENLFNQSKNKCLIKFVPKKNKPSIHDEHYKAELNLSQVMDNDKKSRMSKSKNYSLIYDDDIILDNDGRVSLSKMIKDQFNQIKISNLVEPEKIMECTQDKYIREKSEYVLNFQELNRNIGRFLL